MLALMWLLAFATAFKCDTDLLNKYGFKEIKGVYSADVLKETPPSKTDITWNIGICDTISGIDECKDSQLCGLNKVTLDSKTYVTQIIKTDAEPKFSEEELEGLHGLVATYKNFKWGDNEVTARLTFICPDKDTKDELDKLQIDLWDFRQVELSMKTTAACKAKKRHEKVDNGESWGWFTWIFIFFVLFLSIYIIGGAWFQYSKGNSIDFQTALKEVVENFFEVVKGLPFFIKEIVEKFTGNANRGEYSAV